MHPIWRCINDFHRQGRAGDDEPGKEHDEKRRPIGRVSKRKIETAMLTARAQGKKPLEQAALAATRTAPQKSGHDGRRRCSRLIGHTLTRLERITCEMASRF